MLKYSFQVLKPKVSINLGDHQENMYHSDVSCEEEGYLSYKKLQRTVFGLKW